jgi:hypothetical protein
VPGWSGRRQDLLGDELDVVEVAEVEDLQGEPADAGGLAPASDPVGDLGGRAAPQPRRLPSQSGTREPRVGGAGQPVARVYRE